MDFIIFLSTLIIVIFANLIQCFKLFKNKSSFGVSIDAYYLTLISLLIMFIISNDIYIKIITFSELILTILTIYLIIKYKEIKDKIFNFSKEFKISLLFSCFMIFGISQSILSFKSKNRKSNVSITAYLSWAFLNSLLIYLSTDLFIQIPLIISNILYLYIIFITIKTNKLNS